MQEKKDKPANARRKLGTPRGVSGWKNLSSIGDVGRLHRWIIHSIRDGSLDSKTGMILSQVGCNLVQCLKDSEIEAKLQELEAEAQRRKESELWTTRNGSRA